MMKILVTGGQGFDFIFPLYLLVWKNTKDIAQNVIR